MDEVFFLSEDQMSMHGVLYKKGGNLVKKYKKRWFVLPANSLSLQYFSAPNTKQQGHIDINDILNVSPIINNKKQLHGMKITTSPAKVYELFAKSPEERDAWCNGLLGRLRLIARTKVAARDAMVCNITHFNAPCTMVFEFNIMLVNAFILNNLPFIPLGTSIGFNIN